MARRSRVSNISIQISDGDKIVGLQVLFQVEMDDPENPEMAFTKQDPKNLGADDFSDKEKTDLLSFVELAQAVVKRRR